MEGTASGITLREVDGNDAPPGYDNTEASAWASGYNTAVDDGAHVIKRLQAEVKQLREYAETTRYHQIRHAKAVRELEQLRAELRGGV